jgi:4-diphosphocytidyl-2C-methyl-D-erythritol kinase
MQVRPSNRVIEAMARLESNADWADVIDWLRADERAVADELRDRDDDPGVLRGEGRTVFAICNYAQKANEFAQKIRAPKEGFYP